MLILQPIARFLVKFLSNIINIFKTGLEDGPRPPILGEESESIWLEQFSHSLSPPINGGQGALIRVGFLSGSLPDAHLPASRALSSQQAGRSSGSQQRSI
jgi:hypothetical protein